MAVVPCGAQMAVYILKDKTKRSRKYHTSAKCPMVKAYPNDYEAVTRPPAGYTRCQRAGPCRPRRARVSRRYIP